VNNKITLSEGILLFCIPIIAYIYAYLFELGYANYFNIPSELINIDILPNTPILAGILFMVFILLFMLSNLFYGIMKSKSAVVRIIYNNLVLFFVISTMFLSYNTNPYSWIFLILFTLLVIYEEIYKYNLKYKSNTEIDEFNDRELLDKLINKIGRDKYTLLLIIVWGMIISYGIGSHYPLYKKEFLTLNMPDKKLIVIRKYSDKLICAEKNDSKNTINPNYIVLDYQGDINTIFNVENTGHLSIEAEKGK